MKKISIAAASALVCVLVFTLTKAVALEMTARSGETSEVSDLLGKSVKNFQGEDLGRLTDVVTGPEGSVGFAVLRYWISDDTQKQVAVPFGRLSCKGQECVLDTSKKMLDSAPFFVLEEDLAEPKLAEEIYRHFGVQPYWKGEE